MNGEPLVPHPDDKSPLLEAVTAKAHPKESGHWYRRHAGISHADRYTYEQVATVTARDGSQRPATLRDARKHDYAPGVTTIIGCCDKPGLTNWMVDQGILAALTLPRNAAETEAEYLRRVKEDSKAQAAAAAAEGTRIHAAIQASIQGEPVDHAYLEHVEGIRRVLPAVGGAWIAEATVGHSFGFGTKADLHNGRCLIDFKGKDGDQEALDGMELYDEHLMQLAATHEAIRETTGVGSLRCGILFVSRTHPGAASLRWAFDAKDENDRDGLRAWQMFQALLTYWQLKQNHRPWLKEF